MKTEGKKFLGTLAFSLSVVISLPVLLSRGNMTSQNLLLVYIPVSYSFLHPFQVQLQLGLGLPDSISTQPSSMSRYFFFHPFSFFPLFYLLILTFLSILSQKYLMSKLVYCRQKIMPYEKKTSILKNKTQIHQRTIPAKSKWLLKGHVQQTLTKTILLLKEQEQLVKMQCIYQRKWKTL